MVLLLRAALSAMETARAGIANPKDVSEHKVGAALLKAQEIIAELQATLDPSRAPALCASLADVYSFVTWRLTAARNSGDLVAVNDAIRCFSPIVQAFETAVGGSSNAPRSP